MVEVHAEGSPFGVEHLEYRHDGVETQLTIRCPDCDQRWPVKFAVDPNDSEYVVFTMGCDCGDGDFDLFGLIEKHKVIRQGHLNQLQDACRKIQVALKHPICLERVMSPGFLRCMYGFLEAQVTSAAGSLSDEQLKQEIKKAREVLTDLNGIIDD